MQNIHSSIICAQVLYYFEIFYFHFFSCDNSVFLLYTFCVGELRLPLFNDISSAYKKS